MKPLYRIKNLLILLGCLSVSYIAHGQTPAGDPDAGEMDLLGEPTLELAIMAAHKPIQLWEENVADKLFAKKGRVDEVLYEGVTYRALRLDHIDPEWVKSVDDYLEPEMTRIDGLGDALKPHYDRQMSIYDHVKELILAKHGSFNDAEKRDIEFVDNWRKSIDKDYLRDDNKHALLGIRQLSPLRLYQRRLPYSVGFTKLTEKERLFRKLYKAAIAEEAQHLEFEGVKIEITKNKYGQRIAPSMTEIVYPILSNVNEVLANALEESLPESVTYATDRFKEAVAKEMAEMKDYPEILAKMKKHSDETFARFGTVSGSVSSRELTVGQKIAIAQAARSYADLLNATAQGFYFEWDFINVFRNVDAYLKSLKYTF